MIPFYNEADNVQVVLAELRVALDALGLASEVLAIDDGSSDATARELEAAAQAWPAVRAVRFAQNRGQAAALWHGFQHARGTWIAMLPGE